VNEPRPWFDPDSGLLVVADYIAEMPSFQRVMADAVVTDEELVEQSDRLLNLLHRLEDVLPPGAKAIATEALCELAVMQALYLRRLEEG